MVIRVETGRMVSISRMIPDPLHLKGGEIFSVHFNLPFYYEISRLSLLPMKGFKDLFRSDRKVLKPHSNGVINGIDDGRGRRQLGSFTRLFCTKGAFGVVRLNIHGIN